ncbi:MAG: hypothetical protein HYZ27_04585, partial [Deltaproteobacteria bacterium]|nr:hypothetical protein [Deltaproteobacteria bacterium]
MRRLTLIISLVLAACGRPQNGGGEPGELVLVLKPWSSVSQQAYVGGVATVKVVALRSKGQNIESEGDLIPAADEAIAWRFLGPTPPNASLSAAAAWTDAQGIAFITVGVGTLANITVQVEASAAGADPVAFSIQVRPDLRVLELLVQSPMSTAVDRSETLRVRSRRENLSGPPIAGEPLQFALVGGLRNGARFEPASEPGPVITVDTDPMGLATVRFYTGSVVNLSGYEVEICGQTSCPGVAPARIMLSVGERGVGGADCQYFTDCDDGFVCESGLCQPAAQYCDTDNDCAVGYVCNNSTRLCQLDTGDICDEPADCAGDEICSSNGCCIPPDGCQSNADCEARAGPGWTCDVCSGACLPPTVGDALDVRGQWLTTYHFDISDTLPSFFTNGLGPIVDFLNLLFNDQLDIDVPILGDILEALLSQLVDQYVPQWVQTVVAVLADFIHLFENMEATGEMFLQQTPTGPPLGTQVSGDEKWTTAQFYVVSLCDGGPAAFPNGPGCRVDVVLDSNINVDYSNDDLVVDVKVDPFNGEVMGTTLRLYGRNVEIELAQLINVLL